MKEIGLVLLGFVISLVPVLFERRRRAKAHWSALSAEADISGRLAGIYLRDKVAAPLYRLPVEAFTVSFPALLADGAIAKDEITDLAWFWGRVQDINRGLDNANSAANSDESDRLAREANRLELKCRDLLEGSGGKEGSAETVRRILESHAPSKRVG